MILIAVVLRSWGEPIHQLLVSESQLFWRPGSGSSS